MLLGEKYEYLSKADNKAVYRPYQRLHKIFIVAVLS